MVAVGDSPARRRLAKKRSGLPMPAAASTRLSANCETGRAMVNQLSSERFGKVPRIYVECRRDQSVVYPLQQRMQQLTPGARRISLDCGHVPQLACPQALTDALLDQGHAAGGMSCVVHACHAAPGLAGN